MPHVYYTEYSDEGLRIPEVTRLEHTLGRKLLALGLKEQYQLAFSLDELETNLAFTSAGKPYLEHFPEIRFNITHCSGLAACAFDQKPLGLDAEMPGYFPEILIKRALSEEEKQLLSERGTTPSLREEWFYRLWTLKEACFKKSGVGVDTDLKAISFSFAENDTALTVDCTDPRILCEQTLLPSGHILSLCHEHKGEGMLLIPRAL